MLIREKSVLFSAYNKKQILKLAIVLESLEWKFYATSGTCEFLKNNNLQCINLEEITKVPAILDHRVFTEHYKIAGALVSDPTEKHDLERKKFK